MTGIDQATGDPYQRIAEYYDLEHDVVEDDIELYVAIADQVDGPVLEIGCGSGRLLVPLADAGHNVTGLDRSRAMLDRARNRLLGAGYAGTRVTLFHGDMVEPQAAPGGPFGLVLFSLNALMHLPDAAAQVAALTAARQAMLPHGQVVADVMNPTPQYLLELGRGVLHEWALDLDEGVHIDKWSLRSIDPVGQTIGTTLWYDHLDEHGGLTRTRTEFDLRYVHVSELVLMFRLAGFEDIRVFGSLDLAPVDESSERILVIAGASGFDDDEEPGG